METQNTEETVPVNDAIIEASQEQAPVDVTPNEETPTQVEANGTEGNVELSEWVPNYKYKVRDEEKEFDEWARPFIKDENTYKNFQDLYTRGEGLELAKQERDEFKQKFQTMDDSLNNLNELVRNGQTKEFIEALGLPKKMFMDYAINELKYQELPPEEKARIDAENQQQQQFMMLQNQNKTLEQQTRELQVAQRVNDLERGLSEPSVTAIAQEYDTRIGRAGAFKQLVVERGAYHHAVHKADIPVSQAIQEATQLLGLGTPGTQNQLQTGQVGTQPANQTVPQNRKPVIPNIQARGGAPVKKRVRSLDDIKKIRAQLAAQRG